MSSSPIQDLQDRKKSVDHIVSSALKMSMENRKLKQQLKEVSNVLNSSESKCKRLSTDLGQIKSDVSGLIATQEFNKNGNKNIEVEESNANISKPEKEALDEMLIEKLCMNSVESVGSAQTELFAKEHKELVSQIKNKNVHAILFACFTECCNESGDCGFKEIENESSADGSVLALEGIQNSEKTEPDTDFDCINWLLLLLKYGFLLLVLAFLAIAYIDFYLKANDLEISIHSKASPYF